MLHRYGICPDCGSHIPEHRRDESWVLCECGWMGSNNASKQESELQKATISRMVVTGVFLMLAFLHTSKWGHDSISAIPLQAQVLTGVANTNTVHKYAQLLLKKNMIENGEYYMTRYAETANTKEAYQELALLRTKMNLAQPAVVAFEKYVKLKGRDPLALFHYAQMLEATDKTEKAERVYKYIVGVNKDTYQRTVVEELVRLLVSKNKLKEADTVLAQLSKPNMELPSHLIRQKEWIKQLMQEQSSISSSASL